VASGARDGEAAETVALGALLAWRGRGAHRAFPFGSACAPKSGRSLPLTNKQGTKHKHRILKKKKEKERMIKIADLMG
jgi:hypothetical protein